MANDGNSILLQFMCCGAVPFQCINPFNTQNVFDIDQAHCLPRRVRITAHGTACCAGRPSSCAGYRAPSPTWWPGLYHTGQTERYGS